MFSNRYIFIYSAILVIIVAVALTVVAVQLKPAQQYNERVEKMQNILTSVNIESTPKNAEALFRQYITSSIVVNNQGDVLKNEVAFDINIAEENKKKAADRHLPVFICVNNADTLYAVPLRGKGLWGPIWGYMSFRRDLNTIAGCMYAHKSETPGLGAEIDTRGFQEQFFGKTIFGDDRTFVSVQVHKGGADEADLHGVDAISGGTITSKGLEDMLHNGLKEYTAYFNNIKK